MWSVAWDRTCVVTVRMYWPRLARTLVTLTAWIRSLISGLTSTLKSVNNDKKISLCAWSPFCEPSVRKGNGKGKYHRVTGHEGPEVQYRYSSTISLTSALDGVGGQRHVPAALPPGKTWSHCVGGWVGPRAGLDGYGKSRHPPGFDPRII